MIRRDYMLRGIEEFVRTLARIALLRKGRRWDEASETVDAEFQLLVGEGAQTVARLSETELLARVIRSEPTQAVRDKTLMAIALLHEAGGVASEQGRAEESHEYYLKALHLLLEALARSEDHECPEFVPKVEMIVQALRGAPLPLRTHAMLMEYYERTGQFARAEDALFAMIEAEPNKAEIAEFGLTFYPRLLAQSDAALVAGNLSRAEAQAGMEEVKARLNRNASRKDERVEQVG